MSNKDRASHRLERMRAKTLNSHTDRASNSSAIKNDVWVDCGWGRLIFAHTYKDESKLIEDLLSESDGQRDIAMYVQDPHVVVSKSPHKLFLDPSYTYRLWFDRYTPSRHKASGFSIRLLNSEDDAEALQTLYMRHDMLTPTKSFVKESLSSRIVQHFIAFDNDTNAVIGGALGVDHKRAFDDLEHGSSLWTLATDPQAKHPGIGEAIVRQMVEFYQVRGRAYLDLSVMHNNQSAIALYEKLGFVKVPAFAIKLKNQVNQDLYVGEQLDNRLNIYARVIVNEARRRGIDVKVLMPENGYFALTFGGRSVVCRESLSDLTSAIAMSRCDDKAITHQILANAGISVPRQMTYATNEQAEEFLASVGSVVVKPKKGEQGNGVSVEVKDYSSLKSAIDEAKVFDDHVLLEEFVQGVELRVVVIDYKVVAASLRQRPSIIGNGKDSISSLIKKASRRRSAATSGESTIPLDSETLRCIKNQGHTPDDVMAKGDELEVRKTANLHTGGTMRDVTQILHSELRKAAIDAAKALQIPVTGIDMIVAAPDQSPYVIIEANERPGLANHEPQPTVERFLDFLFPNSIDTA